VLWPRIKRGGVHRGLPEWGLGANLPMCLGTSFLAALLSQIKRFPGQIIWNPNILRGSLDCKHPRVVHTYIHAKSDSSMAKAINGHSTPECAILVSAPIPRVRHFQPFPFSSSENLRLGLGLGLGSVVWLWQYRELFRATTMNDGFQNGGLFGMADPCSEGSTILKAVIHGRCS